MRVVAIVCLLLVLLGAPVVADDDVLTLAPGVKPHAGLDAIYRQFVEGYRTLKPELVSDVYTEDALYLAPNDEITRGHAHIAEIFQSSFDKVRKDGARLDLRFHIVQRQVNGDIAYDVGEYAYTRSAPDKPPLSARGKFVVVAVKSKGGRWMFQVDGYSGIQERKE